jgi:hypothetical protein
MVHYHPTFQTPLLKPTWGFADSKIPVEKVINMETRKSSHRRFCTAKQKVALQKKKKKGTSHSSQIALRDLSEGEH